MKRRPITLILPYYENPGMLCEQQRAWASLSLKTRDCLDVIVVDDGSPTSPALPEVRMKTVRKFSLYRTAVDVRWNWLFCRNLGMQQARTDWVLMTDIDHVVPESTWVALMSRALDPDSAYRFSRVDAPHNGPWSPRPCACGDEDCKGLTEYKAHPNTWFMTRKLFDRVGGYDERFSGYYGTDAEFRDRVTATARQVVMLNEPLVRYPREIIPDASTTTYGRKEEQDRINVQRIRAEREAIPKWRPLRVTFRYEQLV